MSQASLFAEPLPVQEREPFDVCANRHHGNEQSKEANLVVDKEGQRRIIRRLLARNKTLCIHRIVELTGWAANRFSGRMTAGMVDGWLEKSGECEGHGCKAAMYRLTELGKQLAEQEGKL